MENQIDECCPEFEVSKWDKKREIWENRLFIKETMPTLFHMPFPPTIAKKITKMYGQVEKAGAHLPDKADTLILFRDPSAFRSEIYYSVSKKVADSQNAELSGTFVSRVFDGKYNEVPKFIKEMDKYLKENGESAGDYYIHYAYCPLCAKKYGHNYVTLFAKV
ncbi:MAG: hypothetical protein CVT97_08485 [Bacteroidetes bacterium HGW-Bacteroidetes-14]|jgi:hypothetical protein|nr:MAG: hypothetical protein CVT97_08485 [Bacteroidetes bacterium HGW-Bacteroidetes-14]